MYKTQQRQRSLLHINQGSHFLYKFILSRLHISQLANTRWSSVTHSVPLRPKAHHHKYIKLKHRSFTYPWLLFLKWVLTPLSRIWVAFNIIRPLECHVKFRKYTLTYNPGHCWSAGTSETVTIVFHFLSDHFICNVSNIHSSQHSTEAFRRSFVHSCITKSKFKFRSGFIPSYLPTPQKKKASLI